MERRWSRDMPAYARLRGDGLQPRGIDGCGDLEQQLDHGQLECDMGHLFSEDLGFTKRDLPRLAEAADEMKSLDWTPKDSLEDYKDRFAR
jgi:hypothetical protein